MIKLEEKLCIWSVYWIMTVLLQPLCGSVPVGAELLLKLIVQMNGNSISLVWMSGRAAGTRISSVFFLEAEADNPASTPNFCLTWGGGACVCCLMGPKVTNPRVSLGWKVRFKEGSRFCSAPSADENTRAAAKTCLKFHIRGTHLRFHTRLYSFL